MKKIAQNSPPEVCNTCGLKGKKYALTGNGHGKWYYRPRCITCKWRHDRDVANRARAALRAKDPEAWKRQRRAIQLKRYYKMTLEEYEQKLVKQGGGCAICGRKESLKDMPVDHCHTQGHIRGILCHFCNKGLGQFFDSPENLRKAADYIDSWKK